uniref:Coat protein n=1 Tax=Circoviridae sp. TaxID=1954248 RepID=A0A890ULT4_9VIRU|nr:MAG: coat protein [Circoviridae sp.]
MAILRGKWRVRPSYTPRRKSYGRVAPMSRPRGLAYYMRKGRKIKDGSGVTPQYDRTQQYRKSKMPRRRKRQWLKFVKRVTAVSQRNLGTKTVLFNDTLTLPEVTNQGQAFYSLCLYGMHGAEDSATTCGNKDVFTICNNDPDIQKVGSTPTPVQGIITFHSACLDMTMRNSGNVPMEVDLYVVYHRDEVNDSQLVNTFVTAAANTSSISGAGTSLELSNRGATPFDFPMAMAKGKFQVYKKTKYLLPAGGTATYQHRDARNYIFNAANLTDTNGYAWPGKTCSILIIQKRVTGLTELGVMSFGVTRKYSYTVSKNNLAVDQFNP